MSEWLSGMGAGVANHLWQSTAFAVVVWGATLLLRKNAARVRYGLWVAGSVKFLVPFSLLIGLGGVLPRPQHSVVTMPVYSAVDEVGLPFSDVETVPMAAVDPTHAAMKPRHEWGTQAVGLAGVWLCGVVVVLGVWFGGWRKVTRTLRRAVCAEGGREAEILRRVEAAMGGRGRVRLVLSREWMEPGIFGILRPVLIWPEGLSARLDDEHVEAIVTHELMHARRRDNLTAALHMLVEAAFWFHPLVWWMERRMVEERERACDEAVVEMGSRPGVYAESLLKAVRFCVESPLVCVAGVTGADLAGRVRSIMTLRLRRLGVAGKVGLAALAFVAIAGPVAFGVVRMIPVYGQILHATGPLPSYEVVVIKPSQEGARGASTEGEETHYLMTAKMLIQFAYGIFSPPKVMDLNVVGGPDWINADVFSIVGKMDSAEFEQEQKLGRAQKHERRQLMEQSLLADRFKLKMHTETRDVPVYALTVIKGGPKMTPAKDVTGGAHVNPTPGSMAPEELKRGLIVQAKGRNFVMTVKGMTLDMFVDALGGQKETAGKQVVNQTGLTGAYDFTLVWGPEDSAAVDNGDANEVIEPPLFTAIQQQLGLKLAEGKGPGEVVVIDHIEKPVFDEAVAAVHTPIPQILRVPQIQPATSQAAQAVPTTGIATKPIATATDRAATVDSYVPTMTFDVASVRESKLDQGTQWIRVSGGFQPLNSSNLRLENHNLMNLILMAYDVNAALIEGIPRDFAWATFNVEAKADSETDAKLAKLTKEQVRLEQQHMMQVLLADRFGLKVHWETRDSSTFDLVVAKAGRLKSSGESPTADEVKMFGDRGVPPLYQKGDSRSGFHYIAHGTTTDEIAKMLAMQFGKPVSDKTALGAKYDFDLKYYQTRASERKDDETNPWPPLETAIQDQLGLRLAPSHGPVQYLAIDHVERPSEN